MKKYFLSLFPLLLIKNAFPLFFVLSILLNACSKDDSSPNIVQYNEIDQLFTSYGIDTTIIKTKSYIDLHNDTIEFSGIKNGYVWFADYNAKSKQKLAEWEDIEQTNIPLKLYCGYGEYKTYNINKILPLFYKRNENGSIVNISFYYDDINRISQCIFIDNKSSYRTTFGTNQYYELEDWYGECVCMITHYDADAAQPKQQTKVIYNEKGDSIFSLESYSGSLMKNNLVSIEESIETSNSAMSITARRFNYRTNLNIWLKEIPLGFSLPVNAKATFTIQKANNTWTYNYVFLFYDGTKKNFSFSIDTNTGAYNII